MNRGLKSYTKQLTQELGNGCKGSVNINKNDANLHIVLPLLKSVGLSPITTSLIYNYQDRTKSDRFGSGFKLNMYSFIDQIKDGIRVYNADGSYDDYLKKDGYYNKETLCTAENYVSEYHSVDLWYIKDKYGNKRTYYPPIDYPQVIETKAGDIFDINFTSLEKTIKNKHGDVIKFICESGNKITKVVYLHNDVTCASAQLTYDGDKLIRVKQFNEENKIISETAITYLSNAIVVSDALSTFAVKYALSNDGCVNSIISGYGSTFKTKKEIRISYENNKTTVTDQNGKSTYVFFDSNGLPLYLMDSDGNVTETEYNAETKQIESQSNTLSVKSISGNLFPNSIANFTKKGVTVEKVVCSDPFFKEILGDTVYKVTGDGELTYKINTNGIATDNITAVIWGKQLTPRTNSSHVSATLFAGESDHDEFKKEIVDSNFDLMTLGVENKASFKSIELTIFLRGNASIEIGGIQVLKKNFGSFYDYDGKGNAREIGNNGSVSRVGYTSANMPSQIVGPDASVYSCEYDSKGNAKKVSMAYGVTQENEYDDYNNIVKSTITNNDKSKQFVTEKTYKDNGRFLETEKDELGNTIATYDYDVYGKVKSVIDAMGATTEFNYHDTGLIKDILLKNGTTELSKASYTYYANRLIKSVTLMNGSRYDFAYDDCNNLTKIQLNGVTIFTYEYNQETGELIKQLNGDSGDGFTFKYESSQITEVKYFSSNKTEEIRFQYTYNSKNQLTKVVDGKGALIREIEYDVDGNVSKEINAHGSIKYSYDNLGGVNNTKQVIKGKTAYQSFDSVSRSKGTNPQSLQAMFAGDENYIGLFSKDGNLLGKTKGIAPFNHNNEAAKLQLKNFGLVSCALVDGSHTLSYMPSRSRGSEYANGCTQFWFKPKDKSGSTAKCIFNIKGYGYDGISVYLQNGKLILKTTNRDNITETLITTDYKILEQQWNFFALSFINRSDEGTTGITEYALVLNTHVKHYKKSPMIYNVDVGGDTVYSIGHRYDGSQVKEAFTGYITCVNMSTRWYENPSEILKFYRLSKEYFVDYSDNNGSSVADFGVTTRYKSEYENLFDIYPLHNNVVSLKGKKPIDFSIRNHEEYDKDRSFAFNNQTFRYAYVADGSMLTYNLSSGNTGTVMMRAIADECNSKQYLFEAKDSQNKRLGLFRNTDGKLYVDCNGTLTNTGMVFTAGVWHTVGFSMGSLVKVLLDGKWFTFSKSVTYNSTKVTIGRKTDANSIVSNLGVYSDCYPLHGQIEMLCLCSSSCTDTVMNKVAEEMKCSTKTTLYDEFGRYSGEFLFADNGMGLIKGVTYKQNGQNESKQISIETTASTKGFASMRSYDYDNAGRVKKITDSKFENHDYEYDQRGYLTKADGVDYTYDSNGNIESMGSTAFGYDSVIKDRLVKVGNTEIKYGSCNPLNPTEYGDRKFEYEGRRLVKYTIAARETDYYSIPSKTYEYKYDEQGLRIQKIAPEGTTNFVYDGNKLITELAPTYRLDFLYDENNLLYGFTKDCKDTYYYVKDYLQNILGVVDSNGQLVVKYNQTAYGKVTIAQDTNEIGKINPFRYKGYYYDKESGMYYCLSRYYVPEWGRWLNSYEFFLMRSASSCKVNVYCYCDNNTVTKVQKTTTSTRANPANSGIQTGWVAEAIEDKGVSFFAGYDSDRSSNPISWLQTKVFYVEGSVFHNSFAELKLAVATLQFRTPKLLSSLGFSEEDVRNPNLFLNIDCLTAEARVGAGLSVSAKLLSGEIGVQLGDQASIGVQAYVGYGITFDLSTGFKVGLGLGYGFELDIKFDWSKILPWRW